MSASTTTMAVPVRLPPASTPRDEFRDWRRWILRPPAATPSCAMGRVLLISYEFPPVGGSGVQRPAKLVKYLHRLGWQIDVLTAEHDRFPWHDDVLARDIPEECRVHRVPGWEPACLARATTAPARWLETRSILPRGTSNWIEDRIYWRLLYAVDAAGRDNGRTFWISPAVRAAMRLHHRTPFDAVISTGPPHCFHRVALRFAQQARVPWIADLRDPFIHDFDRTPTSRAHDRAMLRLERAVLRHADRVVTTCPALLREFQARHPDLPIERFCTITNGFDRDDLRALIDRPSPSFGGRRVCTLTYVGACYGRTELSKIVEPMERVLAKHADWQGRVRLQVAGTLDGQQTQKWKQQRPEWLELVGYVDHARALDLLMQSCCTLLLLPESQHGRRVIPAKVFELLALPVHLLALVPPGSETEKVAVAGGASTIAPMDDPAAVAAAVERVVGNYFSGRLAKYRDWPALDQYDRQTLTAKYAECLRSARAWKIT